MTNHEIVAAIIAAGMLPPLSVPVRDAKGGIPADEQERLLLAVCHAVGLYRSVLEGVGMRSEPPAVTEDPGPGVAPKRNAAPRLVVGALKRGVPVLAATFLMIASATASDCADADPSADLAGVQGDFELRVDPRSQKKGNLILIANQAD